eukprot:TRINITY_DN7118_c0_g1_i7.p1 TRINITY_DN7118_c0_g1~~TRINITY_DN7118_c0_g1_i7.p1  ORF type:complete len:540 (+),score=108.48 TRINITY_DN7118_c0_g1_i7:54-1673(+)
MIQLSSHHPNQPQQQLDCLFLWITRLPPSRCFRAHTAHPTQAQPPYLQQPPIYNAVPSHANFPAAAYMHSPRNHQPMVHGVQPSIVFHPAAEPIRYPSLRAPQSPPPQPTTIAINPIVDANAHKNPLTGASQQRRSVTPPADHLNVIVIPAPNKSPRGNTSRPASQQIENPITPTSIPSPRGRDKTPPAEESTPGRARATSNKTDNLSARRKTPIPLQIEASLSSLSMFQADRKRIGSYEIRGLLGEGSQGTVWEGFHIETRQKVAVKVVNWKSLTMSNQIKHLKKEILILSRLAHQNSIRFLEVIDDESREVSYIVTEYFDGQDLLHFFNDNYPLSEKKVGRIFLQLVNAISFFHSKGIVHRDLKLENILIDDACNIKVIDFGLSNINTGSARGLLTPCGSPVYVAPEVLFDTTYGKHADVWSLGTILFFLSCNYLPFSRDWYSVYEECYRTKATPPIIFPATLNPELKDLFTKIFVMEPQKRIKLDEILKHPWVAKLKPLKQKSLPKSEFIGPNGIAWMPILGDAIRFISSGTGIKS